MGQQRGAGDRPLSDDAPSSPLFPAPPLETLAGIGTIAHELGSTSRSITPIWAIMPLRPRGRPRLTG
jgi:hypothetical protein